MYIMDVCVLVLLCVCALLIAVGVFVPDSAILVNNFIVYANHFTGLVIVCLLFLFKMSSGLFSGSTKYNADSLLSVLDDFKINLLSEIGKKIEVSDRKIKDLIVNIKDEIVEDIYDLLKKEIPAKDYTLLFDNNSNDNVIKEFFETCKSSRKDIASTTEEVYENCAGWIRKTKIEDNKLLNSDNVKHNELILDTMHGLRRDITNLKNSTNKVHKMICNQLSKKMIVGGEMTEWLVGDEPINVSGNSIATDFASHNVTKNLNEQISRETGAIRKQLPIPSELEVNENDNNIETEAANGSIFKLIKSEPISHETGAIKKQLLIPSEVQINENDNNIETEASNGNILNLNKIESIFRETGAIKNQLPIPSELDLINENYNIIETEAANGSVLKSIESEPISHETGAIKKQIPIPSHTSIDEDLDSSDELQELLKTIAGTLNIKYDCQKIRIICKTNRIIFQFQDEDELKRWLNSAKKNLEMKKRSYGELVSLEEQNVIPNFEEFECPICLCEIAIGEGVTLHDCLHTFCRECITGTVTHSDEVEIQCPSQLGDTTCFGIIQQRELKEIVPEEVYEKYLNRTINVFSTSNSTTVFCMAPDCKNFYICEDDFVSFNCQICCRTTCIPCKATHEGSNCKEYQSGLVELAGTDANAAATLRMFDEMIENKVAMHCPQCNIIITKIEGCDWIKCSMCKTEICWRTFGPRWGPLGVGDTSGGCRCNVGGVKCDPKCGNCH